MWLCVIGWCKRVACGGKWGEYVERVTNKINDDYLCLVIFNNEEMRRWSIFGVLTITL